MLSRIAEQSDIENYLTKALTDLTKSNAVRLKAGLRILMTTNESTFENICSLSVQQDLQDFVQVLRHPEAVAPKTAQSPEGKKQVIEYICAFTLSHLDLIDKRISILPNIETLTKSLRSGEHLKSVVHASALKNVITAAHFYEGVEKKFKTSGVSDKELDQMIRRATEATAKLHNFVLEGNVDGVKRELEVPGVDVTLPNPDGLPLLHLAVREGQLEIVKLLASDPNIDINQVSLGGWAPLHLAARLGYTDIVECLVQQPKIHLNQVNSDGWTALHWAAWHGHTEIVHTLISAGALVNPLDKTKSTPLHWAARNGQADVVALLVAIPTVEVNPQDIDLRTPLHYAVVFEHSAATSALLTSPYIDVNLQERDGLTALHMAAKNGRVDLVGLLLDMPNIQVRIRDHSGLTAEDWAVQNGYMELVPILNNSSFKALFVRKIKQMFLNSVDYIRSMLSPSSG